jgi:hypothetical protein
LSQAIMQRFYLMLISGLSAATLAAGAAESSHGWGPADWGMTEAQVQSAYGDGVETLQLGHGRRTEIVESLRLKNPFVINGVALVGSFGFSRADDSLVRLVLRANVSSVSTGQCRGAYRRIRQSEVEHRAAPLEEKQALNSIHAIWHGPDADAQLSEMEVTGRCFVTLVYKRPSAADPPSNATADSPADHPARIAQ